MALIDLERVTQRHSLQGTVDRATGVKAYLKSDLDFLGVTNGDIAAAVKQVVRETTCLDQRSVIESSSNSFGSPFVHRRMPVISGVTFREAVKYLGDPARGELRAAYKVR